MPFKTVIKDARTGNVAMVTKRGQLVTSPIEFNDIYYISMTQINTAYNIVAPVTNKRFVVDGIIYSGNRDVTAATGAIIEIYEADSATNLTSTKDILTLDVNKLESNSIIGINALLTQGAYLNAKTDDTTTFVTILGYFIKA